MKRKNSITTVRPSEISLADLTTRINDREKKIDAACAIAVKHAMSAVQLAIDQGEDLLLARARVENASRGTHAKKGDVGWTKWLANNYSKGYETARLYMGLSSRVKSHRAGILQNVKSLREAFRILGLVPEPEPEEKQLPSISVSPIVSKLNFVAEWVERSKDEIANWEQIRRQELKLQLKPVVELFEKL
jgi:hypothetical protein